ncbi:MAG TPA: hypothetical protein VLI39_07585 [Sedimentisphaerales bacterium]|nr:hypothetical protein [Sedimentisphaerales bacterium]
MADSDEKKLRDQEVKRDLERKQQLEDLKEIVHSAAGIRFFRRLMEEGKVFQTTFTGNSQGFFWEGHRNLALRFFNDLCEAEPSAVAAILVPKMEDEHA